MAANYIELEQAAALLGLSTDKLNDLRLSGDIHAMRDGGTWKFKMDEIERYADEIGKSLDSAEKDDDAAEDSGVDVVIDEELAEGSDISGLALDLEDDDFEVDSPTTIGKAGEQAAEDAAEESDLGLSVDTIDDESTIAEELPQQTKQEAKQKDASAPAEESDLKLTIDDDSGLPLMADSGLALDDDGDDSGVDFSSGDSSVLVGTEMNLLGDDASGDLDFEGSELGIISGVGLEDEDDLSLDDDDDDELTIGEDDEELALGEDDELVLESGSDITHGAGDTGINLTQPSDSGLNLEEEPLDLAGSSVSSLELPEDDDIIDLEDLDADPDEATQLKADEDFQLEPSVAELEDEDEEDSGSQVIALEDSEAFVEGAAGLSGAEALAEPESEDELEGALEQVEDHPVTQPALPDIAARGPLPEMPYSIWNVLSLLMIVMILSVTGMLMTDLVRNMWSWDQAYPASSSIMDVMVQAIGLDP